jgi:hypothetical protein
MEHLSIQELVAATADPALAPAAGAELGRRAERAEEAERRIAELEHERAMWVRKTRADLFARELRYLQSFKTCAAQHRAIYNS